MDQWAARGFIVTMHSSREPTVSARSGTDPTHPFPMQRLKMRARPTGGGGGGRGGRGALAALALLVVSGGAAAFAPPPLPLPRGRPVPQSALAAKPPPTRNNLDILAGKFSVDVEARYAEEAADGFFGPLLPVATKIDDLTGGWGLSYADLSPETPRTPLGASFLATNVCYAAAGLALASGGEYSLGLLTEVAGAVSFWYHWSQLQLGQDRREVRLSLLIDYFTAGSALVCGGSYLARLGLDVLPDGALLCGGASVVCLALCWVREYDYWYLFWHSAWHIGSAYCAYLIGQANIIAGQV